MKRMIIVLISIVFGPIIFFALSASFVKADLSLLNPLVWNEAARISIVLWIALVVLSIVAGEANSE